MDMLMTLGAPVGCFVAFVLSLIYLTEIVVLPWLALITWKSGGAFWQESVGRDLAGKIAQALNP